MKKISIVGDSFSSDNEADDSWIRLLNKTYVVDNLSQRGISQYRLYKILTSNLDDIQLSDAVILFHTNPDRIYIPDEVTFPSRLLDTHKHCDLVATDSLEKRSWKTVVQNYYRYFYDRDQQILIYEMLIERMSYLLRDCKVIHCSGFDTLPQITSFSILRQQYPGDINHCSAKGNQEIYRYIVQKLKDEKI